MTTTVLGRHWRVDLGSMASRAEAIEGLILAAVSVADTRQQRWNQKDTASEIVFGEHGGDITTYAAIKFRVATFRRKPLL